MVSKVRLQLAHALFNLVYHLALLSLSLFVDICLFPDPSTLPQCTALGKIGVCVGATQCPGTTTPDSGCGASDPSIQCCTFGTSSGISLSHPGSTPQTTPVVNTNMPVTPVNTNVPVTPVNPTNPVAPVAPVTPPTPVTPPAAPVIQVGTYCQANGVTGVCYPNQCPGQYTPTPTCGTQLGCCTNAAPDPNQGGQVDPNDPDPNQPTNPNQPQGPTNPPMTPTPVNNSGGKQSFISKIGSIVGSPIGQQVIGGALKAVGGTQGIGNMIGGLFGGKTDPADPNAPPSSGGIGSIIGGLLGGNNGGTSTGGGIGSMIGGLLGGGNNNGGSNTGGGIGNLIGGLLKGSGNNNGGSNTGTNTGSGLGSLIGGLFGKGDGLFPANGATSKLNRKCTYLVERGDDAKTIAARLSTTVEDISLLNPTMDTAFLSAGTTLTVPCLDANYDPTPTPVLKITVPEVTEPANTEAVADGAGQFGFNAHVDGNCAEGPTPGLIELNKFLMPLGQGQAWWGTDNGFDKTRTSSIHCDGRAVDWVMDACDADRLVEANKIVYQLVDEEGKAAKALGIQLIAFRGKKWDARDKFAETEITTKGIDAFFCDPTNKTPEQGKLKTLAHFDHIHIELNVWGASHFPAQKQTITVNGQGILTDASHIDAAAQKDPSKQHVGLIVEFATAVNLYLEPSLKSSILTSATAGQRGVVTGDHAEADGFKWWPVQLSGRADTLYAPHADGAYFAVDTTFKFSNGELVAVTPVKLVFVKPFTALKARQCVEAEDNVVVINSGDALLKVDGPVMDCKKEWYSVLTTDGQTVWVPFTEAAMGWDNGSSQEQLEEPVKVIAQANDNAAATKSTSLALVHFLFFVLFSLFLS